MIIRQTREPSVWIDEAGRVGPRAFLLGLALEAGRRQGGHVSCVGFDEAVVEHWSFKRLPTGVFHPVKEDPRWVRVSAGRNPGREVRLKGGEKDSGFGSEERGAGS